MSRHRREWGLALLILGAGMLVTLCIVKLGWILCAGLLFVIIGWLWLLN